MEYEVSINKMKLIKYATARLLWHAFKEWTDERLAWQPERFGNLTDIILKADKIWLPELAVMNG